MTAFPIEKIQIGDTHHLLRDWIHVKNLGTGRNVDESSRCIRIEMKYNKSLEDEKVCVVSSGTCIITGQGKETDGNDAMRVTSRWGRV